MMSIQLTFESYFHFHPLVVVSRYRDPQQQVGENYSYLFILRPNICESLCLSTHFFLNDNWFIRVKNGLKLIIDVLSG